MRVNKAFLHVIVTLMWFRAYLQKRTTPRGFSGCKPRIFRDLSPGVMRKIHFLYIIKQKSIANLPQTRAWTCQNIIAHSCFCRTTSGIYCKNALISDKWNLTLQRIETRCECFIDRAVFHQPNLGNIVEPAGTVNRYNELQDTLKLIIHWYLISS